MEHAIVRLHVELPHLGAGQLRHLVRRVLAFKAARETVRGILLRSSALIAELEREKRKPPRRIHVRAARKLWGMELTLVWLLGFFPVWVLGVVDYHRIRVVAFEVLHWPTSAEVVRVVGAAFRAEGIPERILTDRGSLFTSELFDGVLSACGVEHTLTRPCHPWTNGRIERLFRTFKETVAVHFWLVRSRAQLERICRDFIVFYNGHRPHSAYGGRTPDEVHFDWPLRARSSGRIAFFEGRLLWWRLG